MKIIRPYGFSQTVREGETRARWLIEASATKPPPIRDIPEFALKESPLVIGQWISLIDKVARKPNGRFKPIADQREFRERLGKACEKLLFDVKAEHLANIGAAG